MVASGLFCQRLTFSRPGAGVVLNKIDAVFGDGQMALVTGRTGAGKSTLLHLLGAMLPPTSGEIWADGQPVSRWPASHRDVWRRKVGFVFQHLHLRSDLTVKENLLLPLVPRLGRDAGAACGIETLLERLDLAALGGERLQTLSGGQRQRVAVGRALAVAPAFLLLDEPTAFQDDEQTGRLLTLFAETAARGACVIISSHDQRLRAAQNIFQQYRRLHHGRLEVLP